MGKGATTGKTFLENVLSKITDPGQRAAAEAVFANPVVQVEIGNGVEGQSEIDRQLSALQGRATELDTRAQELDQRDTSLKKWHGDLTTWREENVELVKIGGAAKKAGWKPGDPPQQTHQTPTLPEGVITQEQHDKYARDTEAAILGLTAEQNALTREHFATFGEILDITPLLKHPQVREIGLRGAYDAIHKDALATKKTEADQKREEAIRADERQKVLAATATQLPYPLTGSVGADTSPLAAIGKAPGTALVDEAAAHYQRLQVGRPQ